MDVSTRPARPSLVTAHPPGPAGACPVQEPSLRGRWARSVRLRVAAAALLLGAAAAVAALEDRASGDVDQPRTPSVHVVPLAP